MQLHALVITDGLSVNGVQFNMPWYEIKNVAGDATIFLIDKDGDMYLDADAIAVSSAITGPFANSLIIQDAGDEIFVINATNAYFSGKVYPNFATLPTMDGDDMVIQNVAGTPVAIFDGDDNSLYLSGNATHDAVTVEPRNALEFAGATRVAGSYPTGTHEHIVLPSMAIDFSGGMTFEGWFYFDALQNWAHPVSISDGTNTFQILHHATNATLRFNTVNSTSSEWISATDIIDLNEWIHIAYTVTPTGGGVATGRLYKNGILIDTDAAQRSFPNTTWTTGRLAWGSGSDGNMSFDGKLDEFRFWNDVRSESELQSNMTKTYGGIADKTGLVAYWDFNDVLGSKLIDSH
ncbi:MAG: LamG domain-containing protein, partial [Fibrobacterales bacterium]